MAFTLSGDVATTRTNLGLGDAATKTTGTAAGNVPVLDGSGKIADAQLAALAASKLTGIKTVGGVSIAGSGDIATLPSGGTADQVLTSDASGTGTWEDAGGGDYVKIREVSVGTGASLTITGMFSSTYKSYKVFFRHVTPATNGVSLYMRNVQTGGTVTTSGNYKSYTGNVEFYGGGHNNAQHLKHWESTTWNMTPAGATLSNVTAKGGLNMDLTLHDPASSTINTMYCGNYWAYRDGGVNVHTGWAIGTLENITSDEGLYLYFSAGNFASGSIIVYGMK